MSAIEQRQTVLTRTVLIGMSIIFLAPLVVALLTSFKSPSEITRVMSIPTFIVFQNGQEVERLVGFMSKEEMTSQLSKFLA